jgi:hypothetical protein
MEELAGAAPGEAIPGFFGEQLNRQAASESAEKIRRFKSLILRPLHFACGTAPISISGQCH